MSFSAQPSDTVPSAQQTCRSTSSGVPFYNHPGSGVPALPPVRTVRSPSCNQPFPRFTPMMGTRIFFVSLAAACTVPSPPRTIIQSTSRGIPVASSSAASVSSFQSDSLTFSFTVQPSIPNSPGSASWSQVPDLYVYWYISENASSFPALLVCYSV